ncbi:MAG: hypothetical protein ACSHWN_05425 [Methylophilaceae bacterium]
MTSEVLMLNKEAVVIAADSAVTTGRYPHPRYSKSANIIFDLSVHGNVALTIYASADIDNVPWNLAVKQFRKVDQKEVERPKLANYQEALISYLEKNSSLFPAKVLNETLKIRLFKASTYVLNILEHLYPDFTNSERTKKERKTAWSSAYTYFSKVLSETEHKPPFTENTLDGYKPQIAEYLADIANIYEGIKYTYVEHNQLLQLTIDTLLKKPTDFLDYTGLVFAGYGFDEIFPSYCHIWVYGHIGDKLLWTAENGYEITHSNDAWIQPFAQSSMIDRFTDGFDTKLRTNIETESKNLINTIIEKIKENGVEVDEKVSSIFNTEHAQFMKKWIQQNWEENFHPLRRVLNSLSVSEMGHLAESLLVLEELRERVTSPTESVGGPIDVAVITKAEGLIWLKRKHFFNPELNVKYLNRIKLDYT